MEGLALKKFIKLKYFLAISLILVILLISSIFFSKTPGVIKCNTNADEKSISINIEKIQNSNGYFIKANNIPTINDNSSKKQSLILKCTKEQFESIKDNQIYFIQYELNKFNKSDSKVLNISTNPIKAQ